MSHQAHGRYETDISETHGRTRGRIFRLCRVMVLLSQLVARKECGSWWCIGCTNSSSTGEFTHLCLLTTISLHRSNSRLCFWQKNTWRPFIILHFYSIAITEEGNDCNFRSFELRGRKKFFSCKWDFSCHILLVGEQLRQSSMKENLEVYIRVTKCTNLLTQQFSCK